MILFGDLRTRATGGTCMLSDSCAIARPVPRLGDTSRETETFPTSAAPLPTPAIAPRAPQLSFLASSYRSRDKTPSRGPPIPARNERDLGEISRSLRPGLIATVFVIRDRKGSPWWFSASEIRVFSCVCVLWLFWDLTNATGCCG